MTTTTDHAAELAELADEMLPGFLAAGLWADSQDVDLTHEEAEADPDGGRARDAEDFTAEDVEDQDEARTVVRNFLDVLNLTERAEVAENPSEAGHDLWLTANRHGAGFWDGDWTHGDALTEAAHAAGGDLRVEIGTEDGRRVARFVH